MPSPDQHAALGGDRLPDLVLGVGNILRRDDGIGVHSLEALKESRLSAEVEIVDGGTAGLDLLDVVADRHRVVVIDALSAQQQPGTVCRFTPEELRTAVGSRASFHDLGLLETLQVARQLGCAPEQVTIIGVTVVDTDLGLELSPAVAGAIPRIVTMVHDELQEES